MWYVSKLCLFSDICMYICIDMYRFIYIYYLLSFLEMDAVYLLQLLSMAVVKSWPWVPCFWAGGGSVFGLEDPV